MLTRYLAAAMEHAHYEILPEDGAFYGEISLCRGVYAVAATLEQCRDELAGVLEDWLLFRIHKRLPIPPIDGVSLSVRKVAIA